MAIRNAAKRAWLGLGMLVGLLAGCGGGGGGDTPPVAPPPPSLASEALRVNVENVRITRAPDQVGLTQYVLDLFESSGERGSDINVTVDLAGDIAVLNGKTVYVAVVDPDQIFTPEVVLSFSGNTANNSISLRAAKLDGRPGRYRGAVAVNLCLDAACNAPLSKGRLSIPYDVQVRESFRLAGGDALALSSEFSQLSPVVSGKITLPEGAEVPNMQLAFLEPTGIQRALTAPIRLTTQLDRLSFNLQGQAVRPGTYRAAISVSGYATAGGKRSYISKSIPVSYVVAPPASGRPLLPTSSLALSGSYSSFTVAGFEGSLKVIEFRGQTMASLTFLPTDTQRYEVSRVVYFDATGQATTPSCSWASASTFDDEGGLTPQFGPVKLLVNTSGCTHGASSFAAGSAHRSLVPQASWWHGIGRERRRDARRHLELSQGIKEVAQAVADRRQGGDARRRCVALGRSSAR